MLEIYSLAGHAWFAMELSSPIVYGWPRYSRDLARWIELFWFMPSPWKNLTGSSV